MSNNRSLRTSLAMDTICENNENLEISSAHLAGLRALMGLRGGAVMDNQNYNLKTMCTAAEHMSYSASPLSPKNHLLSSPSTQKRPSFSFAQQDEEDFLQVQKTAKRAKASHDAMLLAMMKEGARSEVLGGMNANPLLGAHLQSKMQLASVSPLLLNPALLAATTGYSKLAAAQQLMFSQALASTAGVNPLVQQQINSLINAELSRLASDVDKPATPTEPKSDPSGEAPSHSPSYSLERNDNIACLKLDKEFLPATTQSTRLCDCGMALCHEIGYPHRGTVPFSTETVDQWCQILDITDSSKLQQIKAQPEQYSLACWHFREQDQTVNELTGQLEVTKSSRARPDVHLQVFVDGYEGREKKLKQRRPSERMIELHNYWAQFRRAPTLEP